ncbi:putative reverse transcriptase domain-containing protein [Tanacetum coccineum]
MRRTLMITLVFTLCEEQVIWNSVLMRLIDDLLALDSIVRFGFSDRRLERTATFSISTNSKTKKKKSLDNNNLFLGEYECSSLAVDREERKDEKKRLDHLKQDQTIFGRGRCYGNKGTRRSRKKRGCYNYGEEGHFIGECPKPKENKAFVGGCWSDKEDGDEP